MTLRLERSLMTLLWNSIK